VGRSGPVRRTKGARALTHGRFISFSKPHVLTMKYHDYNKGSPYTKEQIKRRTFWFNFVFFGVYIGIWVIHIHSLFHGGRSHP
jgi:hypothetical protein